MQQVPAGFYGGTAFKIDMSPIANYYIKRQAQQQAKQAALDKYYKGLVANATEKGMRPQEIPAFQQALTNYKTFYTKNSDKIASGLFPELALQAEKLSRIPFEINAASQSYFARDKNVAVIRGSNPDVANRWTQTTWDSYNKSTNPAYIVDKTTGAVVSNPDFVDFDPMSITTNPKEVDLPKQWDDAGKDIERLEQVKDEPDDIDPQFTVKRTVTTAPTTTGLSQAAVKAGSQWNEGTEFTFNKFLNKHFDQYLKDNPDKGKELQASYNKVFPNKTIDNDKDLYIAFAINMADKQELKPTQRIRKEKEWAEWNRKQSLNASKNLAAFTHGLSAAEKQQSQNTRTFFEDIPNGTYKTESGKTVIKNGDYWTDASGKRVTTIPGDPIKIKGSSIPSGFVEGVSPNQRVAVDYMDLNVENGQAIGGYNEFTQLVPRTTAVQKALKGTGVKAPVKTMGAAPADPYNLEF